MPLTYRDGKVKGIGKEKKDKKSIYILEIKYSV